eukprot:6197498-Pleurochrysis_carterae.AAC.3
MVVTSAAPAAATSLAAMTRVQFDDTGMATGSCILALSLITVTKMKCLVTRKTRQCPNLDVSQSVLRCFRDEHSVYFHKYVPTRKQHTHKHPHNRGTMWYSSLPKGHTRQAENRNHEKGCSPARFITLHRARSATRESSGSPANKNKTKQNSNQAVSETS